MKKQLIALLVLGGSFILAQSPDDTLLVKEFRLDFAIPDNPTMEILGNNPSNILRPSTPKELAVSLSDFYGNNGGFIIPDGFSLEASPWLLASSNRTLAEYDQAAYFVRNLRVSLGANRGESDFKSNIAVGVRTTLFDNGDFRNNDEVRAAIYGILSEKNTVDEALKRKFMKDNGVLPVQLADPDMQKKLEEYMGEGESDYKSKSNDDRIVFWQSAIDLENNQPIPNQDLIDTYEQQISILKDERLNSILSENKSYDKKIDEVIDSYKDQYWNAFKWDLAFAVASESKDTLVQNSKFSMFSFWNTWAFRAGSRGQLLVGARVGADTSGIKSIGIPIRYYYGVNKTKGFIECGYDHNKDGNSNGLINSMLINSGVEWNIANGIWLQFTFGYDIDLDTDYAGFTSNFKLNLSLPEKI